MILRAAYILAVLTVACAATFAASLLPIHNPTTASGVCIAAGCFAAWVVLTYLPCPCHHHNHGSNS